jgi:VWFA-related protein
MRLSCERCVPLAGFLFACSIAWSQTGAPEPPIARATSNLVRVNVVAEDAAGNPVADLTRDDFTLFDKGASQRVAFFSVESRSSAGSASVQPPPANVFSNKVERAPGGGVTAILFDGLNTPRTDQAYAREQIGRFLDSVPPGDQVALFALGRGLNVLQDFTTDAQLLRGALRAYKSRPTPAVESEGAGVDSGAVQLGVWLGQLGTGLMDHYAADRAMRTARALTAISRHLEGIAGRKNLIWVSGSFPMWITRDVVLHSGSAGRTSRSFATELGRVIRALGAANVAVYPVDARGLLAPAEYDSSAGEKLASGAIQPGSGNFHTMDVLAARTGGKAFYNNNDIGRAFRQALQDSRVTYQLAFQPSHNKWNGEFRKLKVSVKRSGIRLRYRGGYYAQPDEPASPAYREDVLSAAKWDPPSATRIPLTVRVNPDKAGTWGLEFSVDPRAIQLHADGDTWTGALDIWIVQLGINDLELKTSTQEGQLRLPDVLLERALKTGGLPFQQRVELSPGALLLRLLVRDLHSGAIGTVTIPVKAVQAASAN